MNPTELENIRFFRSDRIAFAPSQIDAEAGILRDVVMVQEGPALGHGVELEAEFVSDLVAFDQKHFGKIGVKARFGHPSASGETMGTQLGTYKNVRLRETKKGNLQAIADLHLLEAADLSPTHPGMREWVLKMAQEQPDFIMSSIVFKPGRYYQKTTKGEKIYVWEYRRKKDEDGYEYNQWIPSNPDLGAVFVEFGSKGEHYYTDLVEAGAATESLFSDTANPHFLVSQARTFLLENPRILEELKKMPQKATDFLASLGVEIPFHQPLKKSMKWSLKKWLLGEEQDADATPTVDQLDELRTSLADAKSKIEQLSTAQKDLTTQLAAAKKSADDLTTHLATANARIAELEAEPAASHTTGATEPDETTDDRPMSDVTARAAEQFAKRKKHAQPKG